MEFSFRPGAVQVPRGARGRADVVAALHDGAGDAAQLVGVADQLAFFHEAGVHEIVVLDAGKGQRGAVGGVALLMARAGQQRDRAVFPPAPCLGGAQLLGGVVARQALVVRRHQVAAFGVGDGRQIFFPAVREEPRRAFLVEPLDFRAAQAEDAAHHQFAHVRRVRLGVSQRQGRPPRPAEHQPLVRAHDLGAQALDIGHQVPGRVVVQAGVRLGTAATALIEQQHVVALRIEQLTMHGRTTAARAAMQEDGGLAVRIARHFPIDLVAVAGIQDAVAVGFDWRVEH
ncbi:hypothetical protein G6F35_013892 [Rhizopus arrhizus]|nr:hypothetical protein G6F35_013892 [Rhizopus arrhizus]